MHEAGMNNRNLVRVLCLLRWIEHTGSGGGASRQMDLKRIEAGLLERSRPQDGVDDVTILRMHHQRSGPKCEQTRLAGTVSGQIHSLHHTGGPATQRTKTNTKDAWGDNGTQWRSRRVE